MVGYVAPLELEGKVRRHGTIRRKTVKTRRRKTTRAKPSSVATPQRSGHPPVADLQEKLKRQARELEEAREEREAIAEVLRIISLSPSELSTVFQSILKNATQLCDAKFGTLSLRENDTFRTVALHNAPLAFLKERQRNPVLRPSPTSGLGRLAATKSVVHISDLRTEQAYSEGVSTTVVLADAAGARTLVIVPMLTENQLIGTIAIYRQEVRPFTDKQIELVQNFAAQTVIAIENARLLNELRESLERQTATSKVLEVISSSPGDLEPVFEAVLKNATRICEANFGQLQLYENGAFRFGAAHNVPSAFAELRQREPLFHPSPLTPLARLVATKQLVHVADYKEHPAYQHGDAGAVRFVDVAGVRTLANVPMLKEEELIGTIQIYRKEVRPFTDKQLELLKNFAAQAVIAIENTRLLNELRQRTADLSESLEQRTATSEVLKIIASSPGDLQPVFHSILQNAAHICEASFGTLFRFDGTFFHPTASIPYCIG